MPLFFDPIVMMLIVFVVLAVLIVLAYQWTASRQDTYAAIVQENDKLFERFAHSLGLTFTPGRITHHPVIGDIAAFGTAQGSYRGFHATLRVTSDETTEPPIVFRTEILLDAPSNATFKKMPVNPLIQQQAQRLEVEPSILKFEPRVPCRARSMSYEFFLVTDATALRELVDMLCDVGETSVLR